MTHPSVLLVEDDEDVARWLRSVLEDRVAEGAGRLRIIHARTLGDALRHLRQGRADCVLLDLALPDSEGMDTFRAVHAAAPEVPVVVLGDGGDDETGTDAIRLGAQDFLARHDPPAGVARAVRHALVRSQWADAVADAARLVAVLDGISDAYLTVDTCGLVTYANRAAEGLLGVRRAEVAGCALEECIPALRGTRAAAAVARALADATAAEMEEHLPVLDRWVEVRLFPSAAGVTAYLRDVTARRAAAEAQLLHQQVLEALPVGVLISEEGSPDRPVCYLNPAFERITGYPADDVMGRDCRFLQGEETDPAAVARMREALAAGEPLRLDVLNYRRDGTPFWNDVSLAPIRDTEGRTAHYVGVVHDVTEARQAEETLRATQRSNAALLANLPGMAYRCSLDPAWNMEFVSEGSLALTGHPPTELVGPGAVPFASLIHPDDQERVWREVRDAVLEGRSFELRYRLVVRGEEKWVWEQGRLVPGVGRALPALEGFVTDVTQQRVLEEQLRQSQKMEAVGRLAGGIAHDFNNLLTAIRATATLMRLELADDDPMRVDADEIMDAVDRAASLSRQLLTFGRGADAREEVVDVSRLLADTSRILRRLIPSGIELSMMLADDPARVRADPRQLEQVLVNLVLNARDAMPEGGTLVVETMNLEVGSRAAGWATGLEPGAYVMLAVHDSGVGIDPGTRERIFEPYFTTKAPGKGTGLGLSIVYGIVKGAGGTVRVSSSPGAGTTFRVLLPAATGDATGAADGVAAGVARQSGTVLLVDDEPAVRRATRRMLERMGLAVLEAANGEEALRTAREHTGTLSLVLTDVVMPLMSGVELARRLAADRPGTPVLLLSGYAEEEVLRDAPAWVEGAFLHKPFSLGELSSAVERLILPPEE